MAHEVAVGYAVRAQQPALAGDEVEEHEAVEQVVGVVARPFRAVSPMRAVEMRPDVLEGLAVIPEELLCDPLDAEGLIMTPPDLFGGPNTISTNPAKDLQVCPVGLLPPDLKGAKPEANFMGIPWIRQPPGGNEGKFVVIVFRREDE